MKRLLYSLVALALLVGVTGYSPAFAQGQKLDLVNPDTGTAFRGENRSTQETVDHRVGRVVLNVMLEDVSSASSTFVAIPITDMRVSFIQSVLMGTITTASATMIIGKYSSDGAYFGEVTNGTSRMVLAATTAGSSDKTGDVDTFTPNQTSGFNYFEKNSVLVIGTDGASTTDTDVMFTITLVPR